MKELFDEWKKRTDITGVASGTKRRDGMDTGEPCIVIYVPKKRPLSELRKDEIIPKRINGIPVDVQEQIFKALSMMPAPPISYRPTTIWTPGGSRVVNYRPAPGGVSVGHYLITAGTLGVWCHKGTDKKMLSNNHVLANCNNGLIGDPIWQPGQYDHGTTSDLIAYLEDFEYVHPESEGIDNDVDCAIAAPTSDSVVDPQIADLTLAVGNWKNATVGMNCTKSGRTTGVTSGTITAVDGSIRVQYPNWVAAFHNQIIIYSDTFLAGGDSGSVALELVEGETPSNIIGLCFAGGSGMAILNNISPVIDALEINFADPVWVQGFVYRGTQIAHNAKVYIYNVSDNTFAGFIQTGYDGYFCLQDVLRRYQSILLFAQVDVGVATYGGYTQKLCREKVNTVSVKVSEYTPIPDGLLCNFRLPNPHFRNGDISPDIYNSLIF